jgi:hypothetical protein
VIETGVLAVGTNTSRERLRVLVFLDTDAFAGAVALAKRRGLITSFTRMN